MDAFVFRRQHVHAERLPPSVRAKWPTDILYEGFIPFPKRLLRCIHRILTDEHALEQLAVLLAVIDTKMPDKEFNPTLPYLAFLAGMEPSTCDEHLKKLRQLGVIDVAEDNMGRLKVTMESLLDQIRSETGSDAGDE